MVPLTLLPLLFLPCVVPQSLSLTLDPSPGFLQLSGETIIAQTLGSWNIQLGPLSLVFDNSLDVDLGLKKRGSLKLAPDPEKRKSRGLTLGLTLDLGLNISLGHVKADVADKSNLTADMNLTDVVGGLEKGVEEVIHGAGGLVGAILDGLGIGSSRSPGVDSKIARGTMSDIEWYLSLSIGSPPQILPLLPDTATSDLFVFSTLCASCPTNHTLYNSTQSSTFIAASPAKSWNLTYGDGSSVIGIVGGDSVMLNTGILTALELALATSVQGQTLTSLPPSGVLGLALDPLVTLPSPATISSTTQGRTLFSRLVKSNSLSQPILGIRLVKSLAYQGKYIGPAIGGAGKFLLGAAEDSYIVGGYAGLKWVPVISSYYWGLNMTDVLVGSTSAFQYTRSTNSRAIIDTGTTLIVTSSELAYYLHYFIPNARQSTTTGIWLIPCTSSAFTGADNVFIELGGNRWGVPIADLVWRVSEEGGGMCISGIQGGMSAFTVLGDMFIKNHYVILPYGSSSSLGNLQIGIGNRTDVPLIS